MKRCTKCGVEKTLECFTFEARRNLPKPQCKVCCTAATQAYKQRERARLKARQQTDADAETQMARRGKELTAMMNTPFCMWRPEWVEYARSITTSR